LLVAYITFGWIAGIPYRFSTCRVYSTQLKTDNVYYLTDEHFEQINRLLPPKNSGPGRPPTGRNCEALATLD